MPGDELEGHERPGDQLEGRERRGDELEGVILVTSCFNYLLMCAVVSSTGFILFWLSYSWSCTSDCSNILLSGS